MRQITFMDSTGINILIAGHRTVTEAGGWLRPAAPTHPVVRVLQLIGIDDIIECRPTLPDAPAP